MRAPRALLPLLLVTSAALAACGGGDETDSGSAGSPGADRTSASATAPRDGGDEVEACDLLTPAQVETAVGTPVRDGIASSGPAVTGGSFTGCLWQSADPDSPADQATITIYPNAAAADSAREDDSADLEGIGDRAFSASVSSVWVYVDERSFFAQWYLFATMDDEGLAQSQALARAVAAAL